ncbi:hypothetical protein cyc_02274 [Cyclospora cayetanensis]|uniref:Uncharacterized protein n=1 Tax=Cyclospora cayetanensis TaxID=88456 RepID=A0A1D3D4P3_9EIME|nr:hypothetical protein cyc_02274 [Cyclospora cayetanensis]
MGGRREGGGERLRRARESRMSAPSPRPCAPLACCALPAEYEATAKEDSRAVQFTCGNGREIRCSSDKRSARAADNAQLRCRTVFRTVLLHAHAAARYERLKAAAAACER